MDLARSCLLVGTGEELSPNGNVWKERFEFYRSAEPKDEEEEDRMMRRAIEESKKLEEERQRQILKETTSRVRQLYAFLLFSSSVPPHFLAGVILLLACLYVCPSPHVCFLNLPVYGCES